MLALDSIQRDGGRSKNPSVVGSCDVRWLLSYTLVEYNSITASTMAVLMPAMLYSYK